MRLKVEDSDGNALKNDKLDGSMRWSFIPFSDSGDGCIIGRIQPYLKDNASLTGDSNGVFRDWFMICCESQPLPEYCGDIGMRPEDTIAGASFRDGMYTIDVIIVPRDTFHVAGCLEPIAEYDVKMMIDNVRSYIEFEEGKSDNPCLRRISGDSSICIPVRWDRIASCIMPFAASRWPEESCYLLFEGQADEKRWITPDAVFEESLRKSRYYFTAGNMATLYSPSDASWSFPKAGLDNRDLPNLRAIRSSEHMIKQSTGCCIEGFGYIAGRVMDTAGPRYRNVTLHIWVTDKENLRGLESRYFSTEENRWGRGNEALR